MALWFNVAIVATSFAVMEFLAWATHKYIMHGWAWRWHKSHHAPRRNLVEPNDAFSFLFATVAIALMIAAQTFPGWGLLFWVGVGMTLYGLVYWLVHDIMTHRRVHLPWQPSHGYLQRLIEAHHLHHVTREREGGVAFGFLYTPPVEELRKELVRQSGASIPHHSSKSPLLHRQSAEDHGSKRPASQHRSVAHARGSARLRQDPEAPSSHV